MTMPAELDPVDPLMPANDHSLVLLVDDQLMVAEAVRRALAEATDVDFHYCGEPREALDMARELKPSLILQDLVMPGVDGLDLVSRYRADPATAAIPIIVLSTREEPATKSEAFARGANDYIVKLPDRVELIARVRYHSAAYLNQLRRDEAFRALRESQQQLIEANLELQRLSSVDGLTGLSNRRYFDEYITTEWRRAIRTQTPISLLMIDVDHFKLYNDGYGHLAGDEVLRTVARTVKQACLRATDIPARYGGEEFAIILPHTDLAGARAMGERVRADVAGLGLPHKGSGSGHVTISMGGATTIPVQGETPDSLIANADASLYAAKHGGRNRLVMHGDAS